MSLDKFVSMYLDYRNNFITIGAFADYYAINDKTAEKIIDIGRQISEINLLETEEC